MAVLEARPYRPFKSSEEYLEAMKEDLAEWLSTLYPELLINAENFMDRLDTGVALCKHANNVRQAAEDYLARRQARNKSMTRSMTSGLAGPILAMGSVHYLPAAKSGTFFSRDNVSNFITWCRKSLKIIECLLFETDDLIMRKNEKHVILCLLEVARRGAKFGMLAPMLVQMERQIDREIAADIKANGIGCGTQTDDGQTTGGTQTDIGIGTEHAATETDMFDTDSEIDEETDEEPVLMYGPQPQIITNDLKSLDEMVRDLVEKCTCPSQFPMVRVSEGKYRIGDTKVLIFVRILRSHVMVRVGGGWDTLSHYLDKHDPCRCRAQHRSSMGARLIPRHNASANGGTGGIELHKAQVIFDRSPPSARKIISNFNSQVSTHQPSSSSTSVSPVAASAATGSSLSPSYGGGKLNRSPTPQRKFFNQLNAASNAFEVANSNGSHNNSNSNGSNVTTSPTGTATSPNYTRRSMSPSPRRLIDMRKKHSSLDVYNNGPKSLPLSTAMTNGLANGAGDSNHVQLDGVDMSAGGGSNGVVGDAHTANTVSSSCSSSSNSNGNSNKFENISDNGSEISDEGYRSLGVIQSSNAGGGSGSGAQKRESVHSQASIEDAETNARLDQTSSDSQLSPTDDPTMPTKISELLDADDSSVMGEPMLDVTVAATVACVVDVNSGPQSLPAMLCAARPNSPATASVNAFEQSGIFITDDEITVDIATSTGLRKTGFSNKIFGGNGDDVANASTLKTASKPKSSNASTKIASSSSSQRRRSIDNSKCSGGSLQDLSARTGLPVFNRAKPTYRSVRKPAMEITPSAAATTRKAAENAKVRPATSTTSAAGRDVTNTWSGRSGAAKKRPTMNADTFTPNANSSNANSNSVSPFERNTRTRSSHILYDSNGRRIKGCTTSLTTSPVKNHSSSPLAQQLLEAASSAKNDAQILEKMKALLSRYSSSNQTLAVNGTRSSSSCNTTPTNAAGKKQQQQQPIYEDFTTAWVHSNGNLERSSSCSPPTKTLSKRSSAASSTESTHSRDMASTIISPRRERGGASKIPAPVRQHTELY